MATNDFIGFASSGNANVMSQVDYAAAHEQLVGVQPGMATSALANKIWRQGSNMAAALGDLMSAQGYDALDDGDISKLAKNLSMAVALTIEYNATCDFKSGSICRYIGDLYVALVDNGPGTSVKNPTDTTAWAKVILTTATTSDAGYMSATDKLKLDNIQPMTGASAILAGASGLVPQPAAGDQAKALLGNGGWGDLTDIAGTLPIGKGGTGQTTAYNAYKAFIDGSSSDKQYASRSSATVNNSPQFWYLCTGIVVYVGVYFQLANALSSYSSVVVATGFPNNACADAGDLSGMHCIATDNMALNDCGISITSSGDCKLFARDTSIPANTWLYAEFVYPRSL